MNNLSCTYIFFMRLITIIRVLVSAIWMLLLFHACQKPSPPSPNYTDRQRLMLDTTDNHTKNIDSLKQFVLKFHQSGDREREMAALAELGHSYQSASQYTQAIKTHREQVRIADNLGDDLMKVSGLNDMAVNYRRMGLNYEGLNYHSQAIAIGNEAGKKDRDKHEKFLKCSAIGYNGSGNVYLNIGHYKAADSMLRKALDIETKLGSHLGMNVDYSNLGMVFEKRGMIDSAWVYFRKAYEHSQIAKSSTGMAYCHMHFGRLYQRQQQYDKAITEFQLSMDVIPRGRDLWLWLQPCIAMADVQVTVNNKEQAKKYLAVALETAQKIQGKEYFAQIYRIYSNYYKNQGMFDKALDYYVKANEAEGNLIGSTQMFEIETLQSEMAHRQNMERMEKANRELKIARTERLLLGIGILVLLALSLMLWYISRIRLRTNRMQQSFMKIRNRFFTNITHEFRTPLTVILGMAEELQESEKASLEKQQKAGEMIRRQGQALLTLVNQLLDISKVKSEVGEPDWRRGNVVPYIHMLVEGYQQLASKKNIVLLYAPKENEVVMDIVPDYLTKIIYNLVGNAVKYTPANGNISITSQIDMDSLEIMVADSGQGVGPEHLKHLFDPFFQVADDSHNIGTGVGLALVKQLVLAMKGNIKVASAVGKGTVFTIHLPLSHGNSKWNPIEENVNLPVYTPTEESDNELSELQQVEEPDGKTSVLVVEDNSDVARYIIGQIPKSNRVYYASNGEDGLDKAKNLLPDIVITDLMMPGMDGLELCRRLRNTHATATIPVIVITAKTSQEDVEAGLKAGANVYLTKPFSGKELRIRMNWILTERRMLREKFLLSTLEIDEAHPNLPKEDLAFISQFTNAIYDHMQDENFDIEALALKFCMSPRSLRRKVSELTHTSVSTYISKIRIDYAKQLLKRYPDLPVNEVAMRSGFYDQSYFSRVFKQAVGTTPIQFRKNVQITP